jgi:hypothetical protein
MRIRSLILGTIDWAGQEILPMVFGMLLRPLEASIVSRAPKGKTLLGPRNGRRGPIHLRRGHVADETGFVELEDSTDPRETRYVIHYHEAERAGPHFDIRILYRGRAVSWAVPMKGKREVLSRMPMPGERWLAVRQPDHTKQYMTFEGVIPEGLGKGRVTVWDEGIADILKVEDGNVHVRLYGKAAGDYVLVDTGNKQGLLITKASSKPDEWTKPPYIKKDQDLLVELASDPTKVAEVKVDGAALEVVLGERENRIYSHRVSKRTGNLVEHTDRLPHLRDLRVPDLAGTKLRVEGYHRSGSDFLSGTLNSKVERARWLQKHHGAIKFAVFDVTYYKGEDVRNLPYEQREAIYTLVAERLKAAGVQPVRQAQTRNWERFFEETVDRQTIPTDGIIVKGSDQAYGEGPWIKVKPSNETDCVVVGLSEGLGRHSGRLGALTVETPDGKRVQVGTGFSDWERQWIWDHKTDLVGETARVLFHVRAGEATATGPRFKDWHPDKSDVALDMYRDALKRSSGEVA